MSFFIRAILVAGVNLGAAGWWNEFQRDYPGSMHVAFLIPTQFVLYNVLPYMTLMYVHFTNMMRHDDRQSQHVTDSKTLEKTKKY